MDDCEAFAELHLLVAVARFTFRSRRVINRFIHSRLVTVS